MSTSAQLTCQHKWISTKEPDTLQCLWGCGATRQVEDAVLTPGFQEMTPQEEYEETL